MRDPIDQLESFTTPDLGDVPLDAAEVRRRGDRRRRRTTALTAVGGVAAVAVVVAPLVALAGHQDSSAPEPAPSPSVSWLQEIPGDFPLTDGMPTSVTTTDGYQPRVTDICDRAGWDPDGAVGARQAVHSDRSEGGQDRTLALYPTDREAELTLLSLQAGLQACSIGTAEQDRRAEVVDSALGSDSLVYANHYTDGGDTDVVQLVRVGNAILQDTMYTLGGGDTDVVQGVADRLERSSATTRAALCVFSATGCGSPSTAADPVTSASANAMTAIPADFPLLDGLPTRAATDRFGRYGPGQDEDLLTVPGCGEDTLATPEPVDWLRGGWHDPAEARERQLVVFSSVAEASSYLDAFTDLATCTTEQVGGGMTRIHSGAGSDLGLGDAAQINILWHRVDGQPAPGFRITEFVRVGNAVLVQDRIADGLNDKVTSAYLEQIIGESDQSLAGVVAAMDVFAD